VRVILWTPRACADLAAIRAFIEQDSPHYAAIVVSRLIAGTDRLASFPQSGRAVPEFENPHVREVVIRPYRIVYRLVGDGEIHILTVHHSSQNFPATV
jgi:addiction module RelE/StbE family toxin